MGRGFIVVFGWGLLASSISTSDTRDMYSIHGRSRRQQRYRRYQLPRAWQSSDRPCPSSFLFRLSRRRRGCSRVLGGRWCCRRGRARRGRQALGKVHPLVVARRDPEVDWREGPIAYGQWPVRRSTIVGCFGPIAGPNREALAVVRPLVLVDRLELVPGHRAVAVGSLDFVAGILAPEEDILDPVVGSLDPVEDIDVVGEDDHLQGRPDHRTSPTPHARQVHREMSL